MNLASFGSIYFHLAKWRLNHEPFDADVPSKCFFKQGTPLRLNIWFLAEEVVKENKQSGQDPATPPAPVR